MKKKYLLFTGVAVISVCWLTFAWVNPVHSGAPEEQTLVIVKATTDFLQSLSEAQRNKILFSF
ncbi:MAG TPA: hypothetical protein VKR53_14125, partial [Puia sp.]|nr:hypothetical protein [Puia sp.]